MFDHAIFNDCMANVDFCEQMVKDTNPSLLAKAENTSSPHKDIHGYATIADIMRALYPFTGSFYRRRSRWLATRVKGNTAGLVAANTNRRLLCLVAAARTSPIRR